MGRRGSSNHQYTHLRKLHRSFWGRWYRMNNRHRFEKAYVDVQVHPDWQGDAGFVQFYDDMGLPPTNAHQLDRINPFGNYEKSNCRWVTALENSNNMRFHHSEKGRKAKLAVENGIPKTTYYDRVRRGWNLDDACTIPTRYGPHYRKRIL